MTQKKMTIDQLRLINSEIDTSELQLLIKKLENFFEAKKIDLFAFVNNFSHYKNDLQYISDIKLLYVLLDFYYDLEKVTETTEPIEGLLFDKSFDRKLFRYLEESIDTLLSDLVDYTNESEYKYETFKGVLTMLTAPPD